MDQSPTTANADSLAQDEAAAYLQKHLKKIRGHVKKLARSRRSGPDNAATELVHDLRVGIRRVRTGLDVFRPLLPKGLRRSLNKRAHKLQDSASRVRDLDVWRLELERLRSGQRYRKALDFALGKALQERQLLNKKLRKMSERLEDQQTWQSASSDLLKALAKRAKGAPLSLPDLAAAVLPERIRALVKSFKNLDFSDPNALHRTRIAAKKVRYTLEIFMKAVPPSHAKRAYEYLRDLQSSLGELRDCVVFSEICRELGSDHEVDGPTRASLELLGHYYERRVAHKMKDFQMSLTHAHHEEAMKDLTALT